MESAESFCEDMEGMPRKARSADAVIFWKQGKQHKQLNGLVNCPHGYQESEGTTNRIWQWKLRFNSRILIMVYYNRVV